MYQSNSSVCSGAVPSCSQEGDLLDMDDLLRFSYQVAQGLEFLAAKNVGSPEHFLKSLIVFMCVNYPKNLKYSKWKQTD